MKMIKRLQVAGFELGWLNAISNGGGWQAKLKGMRSSSEGLKFVRTILEC